MSSFGTQSDQTLNRAADVPLDIRPTPLPAPKHTEAVVLHRYWLGCKDRGGMMLGRDLPSRELAKLMSKLSVLQSNAGQTDFRFRLVGSSWLQRFGRDIEGAWLSSLYNSEILERYRAGVHTILRTGDPKFTDVHVLQGGRQMHHLEYIQLPLASVADAEPCVLVGAFRHA